MSIRLWTASLLGVLASGLPAAGGPAPAPKLKLTEFGSDSTAFDVISTLIEGPTEALLWDAQYHVSDARRLADGIAATGKHLKAIVISHPDHDHYMGAAILVERFPGTPVYLTPAALEEYNRTAAQNLKGEKMRPGGEAPDSVVTPQPLPSDHLTVDGQEVELIPDLAGDVLKPTNSILWIPSLKTVLAADVAFNGVHPWLGSSDSASRAAWRASLKRVASLHPTTVVAGHKRNLDAPDSPDVLDFMERYLDDFDAGLHASADPQAFLATMKQKYPDLAVPVLVIFSTRIAFRAKAGS